MESETPLIAYGEENFLFERKCPTCGRFVKADSGITFKTDEWGSLAEYKENAICKKCGRVKMNFIGHI